MTRYFAIISVLLFIISIITAFWGPKKWLIISAISSFLGGLFMGMINGINTEGVLLGLFWGLVVLFLNVISGIWVRYGKERGKRTLEKYWGKKTEIMPKKRGNKKD